MKAQRHFNEAGHPQDFQKELEAELECLKQVLKLGYELKVMRFPNKKTQRFPAK